MIIVVMRPNLHLIMCKSVKIRELKAPEADLSKFDPGCYLANLEFYETDETVSNEDRDGLAQFIHFLAFLALQSQSSHWDSSIVPRGSSAFRAIESHFNDLDGWDAAALDKGDISYRDLASFLMSHFPPRSPRS